MLIRTILSPKEMEDKYAYYVYFSGSQIEFLHSLPVCDFYFHNIYRIICSHLSIGCMYALNVAGYWLTALVLPTS